MMLEEKAFLCYYRNSEMAFYVSTHLVSSFVIMGIWATQSNMNYHSSFDESQLISRKIARKYKLKCSEIISQLFTVYSNTIIVKV